ncbi:hypothetical protein Tco_0863296 [Tanacetum coccineum]
MSGSVGSNVNVGVNIVDGKPLKSILKKPKVKNVAGKPFQVRRKVAIGHDDAMETDFPSPLKSVWREEPVTCVLSPREVSKPANAVGNEASTNGIGAGNSNSSILKSFSSVLSHNGATNVIPDGSPTKASVLYANPLNSERVNFCSLLNEEKVESYDCVLPHDVADVVKNDYENTVVGYFLGKSLAFPIVQNYKREVTYVPVWVKLHGVPVLAYSGDGLSLIATQIVSSKSELKMEVTRAILNEKGDGYIKEVIRVEYEWKPPHCGDCKIFGHDLLQCPKHVEENAFNDPS